MRKLSGWAHRHKWTVRIGIVAIYFLLNAIGFFLGDILSQSEIFIPAYIPYLLTIPVLVAFVFYPDRNKKARYKHFYRSRKIADASLAGITFLLIICMSNQLSVQKGWQPIAAYSASVVPPHGNALETNHIKEPTPPKKKRNNLSIKQLRKNLRENIQILRKEYKAAADAGKIGLIVLSIIVALGLLYLLAALSCSIACSGAEALAWLVFLLGTGLIVFLLIRTIRRISGKTGNATVRTNFF